MIIAICSALCAVISLIVGIWKYFSRKNRELRRMADAAAEEITVGLADNNPSLITAGLDRLARMR